MKLLRYYDRVQQFQRITIDPEMMGGANLTGLVRQVLPTRY